MSEEKKQRAPSSSYVKIISKTVGVYYYQVIDKTGIIIESDELKTEIECRKQIQRLRKVLKNRFMRIEIE